MLTWNLTCHHFLFGVMSEHTQCCKQVYKIFYVESYHAASSYFNPFELKDTVCTERYLKAECDFCLAGVQ